VRVVAAYILPVIVRKVSDASSLRSCVRALYVRVLRGCRRVNYTHTSSLTANNRAPRSGHTGIMSFQKRKQWEGMFEDGVVVEGIETGEPPSVLLTEDADESTLLGTTAPINEESGVTPKLAAPSATGGTGSAGGAESAAGGSRPVSAKGVSGIGASFAAAGGSGASAGSAVRKTDDVNTFLQTVDLAGVPQGGCGGNSYVVHVWCVGVIVLYCRFLCSSRASMCWRSNHACS
jgi:hypothetical protein